MKLILSSDALPRGDLGALIYACGRRALAGLEVAIGQAHGHGLERPDGTPEIRQWQSLSSDSPVPIQWLRFSADVDALAPQYAPLAQDHGVGFLIERPLDQLPGENVALLHGSDPDDAAAAAAWAAKHGAYTCWQVGAERAEPDAMEAVLEITFSALAHVRMLGGGPEADPLDTGSGTGSILSRLALRGYGGTIALVPGSRDRLAEWERWLMKTRGWGCSTAAEKQAKAQARRRYTLEEL